MSMWSFNGLDQVFDGCGLDVVDVVGVFFALQKFEGINNLREIFGWGGVPQQ